MPNMQARPYIYMLTRSAQGKGRGSQNKKKSILHRNYKLGLSMNRKDIFKFSVFKQFRQTLDCLEQLIFFMNILEIYNFDRFC